MNAQELMEKEYQEMRQLINPTFKQLLKKNAEAGLLIFVKWGLALILAYFALTFGTQLVTGSINGTQSAIYLNELQNKGYLPKVVNGQVPPKPEVERETPNITK